MASSESKNPVPNQPGASYCATVVVLNGASSAGKTTLALELQRSLRGTWLHYKTDRFMAMLPDDPPLDAWARLIQASNRSVGTYAATGNPITVDTVFARREWLDDLVLGLSGHPALLVAVTCSLAELERREAARGDRAPGQAARQAGVVHSWCGSDLTVHTDTMSPAQCCAAIEERLRDPVSPHALAAHARSMAGS